MQEDHVFLLAEGALADQIREARQGFSRVHGIQQQSLAAGGEGQGQDWESVGRGNPRGRVGTMEDIAGLAIFLSSRAGAYTVGETITCDGGAVASS